MIYNALWEEQVRAYEIYLQPDGVAGMNIGVLVDQGYATPGITNMLISTPKDIFAPWAMKGGQRILTVDETRELMTLLEESRAFGPPKDGIASARQRLLVDRCLLPEWSLGFPSLPLSTDGFANVKFSGQAVLVGQCAIPSIRRASSSRRNCAATGTLRSTAPAPTAGCWSSERTACGRGSGTR